MTLWKTTTAIPYKIVQNLVALSPIPLQKHFFRFQTKKKTIRILVILAVYPIIVGQKEVENCYITANKRSSDRAFPRLCPKVPFLPLSKTEKKNTGSIFLWRNTAGSLQKLQ